MFTPHITVLKIKMLNKWPLGFQIEDREIEWEKINKQVDTRGEMGRPCHQTTN